MSFSRAYQVAFCWLTRICLKGLAFGDSDVTDLINACDGLKQLTLSSRWMVEHSVLKIDTPGQGTVCLELLEQVPKIDTIIVPISGGGLIYGVALAVKAINPSIRILAAEPKGADDLAQSKAAGRIIKLPATNTIADGLRAFLGDLTWPVVRDLVDDVIVMDDNAIVDAVKMCYETPKVAVEPSGSHWPCRYPLRRVQAELCLA
ncbi:putative serine racemase [Hordeum vulgare]|nr:putative serine racemase [Hordeum vulgare]